MQQAFVPQVAQHPFPVAGDGHAARAARDVAQFQDREFHRGIHRHINPQLGGDAVFGMLEHGIAETVANDIGRCAARGQRGGRPELAGLLVADIERLPGGVLTGSLLQGVSRNSWEFSTQV